MSNHRTEVASIRKADGCEIRVAIDHYKGRRIVDFRLWWLPKGGAEHVPSRKGLTFDADKLAELSQALTAATSLLGASK